MENLDKIGNLRFCYERNGENDLTLYAINGRDIVAQEVYFTNDPLDAMRDMLRRIFDTFTLRDIRAALPSIRIEEEGLISGVIAGFSTREYFKRIDKTEFWKHYAHRPMIQEG